MLFPINSIRYEMECNERQKYLPLIFLSFYATSFDYYYYLRITKTTQL